MKERNEKMHDHSYSVAFNYVTSSSISIKKSKWHYLFRNVICMIVLFSTSLLLTSCGKDTKAKALEKFANQDMAKINVAYNHFAKDYAASPSYAEGMELYADYVNDPLLKELDDIIKQTQAIKTDQKEIKDLKAKYVKAMKGYRKALAQCAAAASAQDTQALEQARSEIASVGDSLQDYNDSLRLLAKKYKLTVKEPEE